MFAPSGGEPERPCEGLPPQLTSFLRVFRQGDRLREVAALVVDVVEFGTQTMGLRPWAESGPYPVKDRHRALRHQIPGGGEESAAARPWKRAVARSVLTTCRRHDFSPPRFWCGKLGRPMRTCSFCAEEIQDAAVAWNIVNSPEFADGFVPHLEIFAKRLS